MIRASQLVIACSGAYGIPLLMKWSAISDSQVLILTGIPQIVVLPGVGHGYDDYHTVCQPLVPPYLTHLPNRFPQPIWNHAISNSRYGVVKL